jgi:hypothetical protein
MQGYMHIKQQRRQGELPLTRILGDRTHSSIQNLDTYL